MARHNGGRAVDIIFGSVEEHILADGKEDGMSKVDVLDAINDFREEKGKSLLGKNAVEGALKQMSTKIVSVTKPWQQRSRERLGSSKVQLRQTVTNPNRRDHNQ